MSQSPTLSALLRREKSTEVRAQKATDAHHLAHMAARRAAHRIVWDCLSKRGISKGSIVSITDEKEASYWDVNKLLLVCIDIYPPSRHRVDDGWSATFTFKPFGSKNVPLLTRRYLHFSEKHPKNMAKHIVLHKSGAKA